MTNETTDHNRPWQTPWPNEGLEHLGYCPVCDKSERSELHKNIVDNVFFCSPGKWTLWRCANCKSAYLDPRPTPDTINLAYASYYTHQEAGVKDEYASLSMLRKVRRCLVNGYTNWRFSTNAMPSSAMGVPVVFVIPKLKKLIDQQYRHLPRLPKGGGRLLDVGCGDGSFLRHARNCGWDVVGLDPDTKAVANAAKHGLVVHQGGIELFRDQFELFDVITLNHVIEHVHDPVVLLKACHSLLKHGGQLWLSTPNIDSFGHYRFQKNWRGLETPRHLVIFNRRSLNRAFIAAGFLAPTDRACVSPCKGMFNMSSAMEQGHTHNEIIDPPLTVKLQTWMAELGEMVLPSRREFLIVSTRKAVS